MALWINQDGLPLQFGTDKAVADLGGDYLMYGAQRCYETFVNLGATSFGVGGLQNPALPSSFTGTSTVAAAGIVSLTTLFPLQPTTPITVANSSGVLNYVAPQLRIDQVDIDVLVAAAAGGGGATGLTGIGLVTVQNTAPQQFVQVTPNPGVQFLGAASNAQLAVNKHYTYYADGSSFGSSTNGAFTAAPTAGSWLGQVPKVTNAITPLPAGAYVSAIAAGGTFTGSGGGGLLLTRVYYRWYGNIAN